MTRAIARFIVTQGSMRVRVRVLPTTDDVHREFRKGWRCSDKERVIAFFAPASDQAKHVGTIVLGANGRLAEHVPHEVTHAVMCRYGTVHVAVDEPVATAIGLLSARIFGQLKLRGLEV